MKKVVAILVVFLILAGTVAFAADTSSSSDESMVRKFFGNAQKLFEQQIPDTPKQKSQTHTIWKQTGPGTETQRSGK